MSFKKLVCLDFDGTIHSYSSGWKGARNIPDPPVPCSINWIENFIDSHCDPPESMYAMAAPGTHELAIFSSRSRYFGGRRAMKKWLVKHGLDKRYLEVIKFPLWKPSASVLIDDRAITFTGIWPSFKEVVNFKPWNK